MDSDDEDLSYVSESEAVENHRRKENHGGSETSILLPHAEFDRLRREGRCFKCRDKGHLRQDCPESDDEPKFEARAARLTDIEEVEEIETDFDSLEHHSADSAEERAKSPESFHAEFDDQSESTDEGDSDSSYGYY
ncbi:hypothetical protein FB451DRAFT_1189042 [Mycena latifolia]|nr:hypothetical protein FB451DRAFT_1189042 [Mycena latifolia]